METIDNPFRKAGIVLLSIGILDIGVMIYCIVNKISYSSSFNIFAVIAGVFLMKGGVKTARVVRWFIAFFSMAFIGMLSLFPIAMPIGLLETQIKLNPVGMLGSYAFSIVFIGVLVWVYRQLSAPDALEKLRQAGFKTGKPKSALYVALAFIVLGGVLFGFLFNSESAMKTKKLAKEQLGPNYKYHISSLNMSGNSGSAVVTAYNSNEIKNVQVKW
ncbi:MAG: hypothetical protein BMS9Abin18_0414 [Zetaproteobacteria bacterium]|nr:MAG: hypothetical protein BMS9Abin18_0414 [Zetaproteobacteria bacterium]